MQPAGRIDVIDLFEPERAALLDVLASLAADEWRAPTVCAGWSVKDVAAHIIADDFGIVSGGRDRYDIGWFSGPWEELLAYINKRNEAWVAAMRRVSPQLIVELLRFSGERMAAEFRARDLDAIGVPVDWAGPEPAPAWLHVAREYTERWLHQQQIRDAVKRPGLKDARMFAPVLDAFVRAMPHTYRDVAAPDGTHVLLTITGEAGGAWSLIMRDGSWSLYRDAGTPPAASVTVDQETAWRLFTKGIDAGAARAAAKITGDRALGEVALSMVSILA
jgi:uncharacterized protein (TIGR03083 family)